MKFILATIATIASLGQAIKLTNSEVNPTAGESFELTWDEAEGPVTIELVWGPGDNLNKDQVIASGINGDSYTWEVPEDLVPRTNYAFYINDGTGENWSIPFALEGTGEETATSAVPSETSSEAATSTEASTTTEEASSTLTTTVTSEVPSSTEASETSSTQSSTSSAASASETAPLDSKAGRLGSPVALIFTLAAILYFN